MHRIHWDTVFMIDGLDLRRYQWLYVGLFCEKNDAISSFSEIELVRSMKETVKLKSLGIMDKLPSSDHLPMFANLLFINSTPELNICSTSSDKVTFNRCKASDYDILHYRNLTFLNISMIYTCFTCNEM